MAKDKNDRCWITDFKDYWISRIIEDVIVLNSMVICRFHTWPLGVACLLIIMPPAAQIFLKSPLAPGGTNLPLPPGFESRILGITGFHGWWYHVRRGEWHSPSHDTGTFSYCRNIGSHVKWNKKYIMVKKGLIQFAPTWTFKRCYWYLDLNQDL